MNKKRLLVYVIAVSVVIGSSSFVYAAKNSTNSRKNVVESTVVEAEKTESETKTGYISDEEAVEIAVKVMKDYLNKDADYYIKNTVQRQDWSLNTEIEIEGQKYMVSETFARWIQYKLDDNEIEGARNQLVEALKERPNMILINFIPKDIDEDRFTLNSVCINADTREVLSVDAHNNLVEFQGEPDKNKVQTAVLEFFDKINTEIDKDTVLGKYDVDNYLGRITMKLKLSDGNKVSLVLDLKDYSVITYSKDYLLYPEN